MKLGKKTINENLEDLRKRLVTSMRLGSMYVLDCGALIPDFNQTFTTSESSIFPTDTIFQFDLFRKYETYMQLVRDDENFDIMESPNTYCMAKDFNIIFLAKYQSDEKCETLLANIPHSEKMMKIIVVE